MHQSITRGISINYMYSLKDRCNVDLYFKMKSKHGFGFLPDEKGEFIEGILGELQSMQFDRVVIPESSNEVLNLIASKSSADVSVLKKRGGLAIVEDLKQLKLQKAQMLKLVKLLGDASTVKFGGLPANLRGIISPYLFEPLPIPSDQKVLYLDDSSFTGYTLLAAKHAIQSDNVNYICMFHYPEVPSAEQWTVTVKLIEN